MSDLGGPIKDASVTATSEAVEESSDDEMFPFVEDVPNPRLVKEREAKAIADAEAKQKEDEEAAAIAAHEAKMAEIEERAKTIERMPEGLTRYCVHTCRYMVLKQFFEAPPEHCDRSRRSA